MDGFTADRRLRQLRDEINEYDSLGRFNVSDRSRDERDDILRSVYGWTVEDFEHREEVS